MWQLKMTNAAREWLDIGQFKTVTDAARCVREFEGRSTGGIFFEILVEIDHGSTDEDAFSCLQYTGRNALYAIRRRVN